MGLLATGTLTPPDTGGTPAVPDDPDPDGWTGRDRGRQQATALLTLAAAALAGMFAEGGRRVARPLFVVHLGTRATSATAAGVLELDLPGGLPHLTGRLVERLAAGADV